MKLLTKTSLIIGGNEHCVKVYRDSEWDEYVCRLFINGTENKNASYHTDDKLDALWTSTKMIVNA